MKIPRWAWAVVGAIAGAIEAVAIRNKIKGDTLSEVLRSALGIKPRRWWRPLGVAAVLAACIWLADHLIRG